MNDVKCPVCSETTVSLLEKKETYHLDQAIFYDGFLSCCLLNYK